MNCLRKEDMVYLMLDEFQDEADNWVLQNHLNGCPGCQKQYQLLKGEMKNIVLKNSQECELILSHLQNYYEGQIKSVSGIDIARHLKQCDTCAAIYHLLQKEVTLEESRKIDIPIPKRLKKRIHHLLDRLDSDSIKKKIDEFIEKIALTLEPAPAPAFLSEFHGAEKQVEIKGPEIKVAVGSAGRIVKIFSEAGEELARQISDEKGMVSFKDFLPDIYKIGVEGFEILDIEYTNR